MSTTEDPGTRGAELSDSDLDLAAASAIDAVRGPRGVLATGPRARLYAAVVDPRSSWSDARSIVITPDGLTSLALAVVRHTPYDGFVESRRLPTTAEVLAALVAVAPR